MLRTGGQGLDLAQRALRRGPLLGAAVAELAEIVVASGPGGPVDPLEERVLVVE